MNKRQSSVLANAVLLFVLCGGTVAAEVLTTIATGEYRMGDNDNRTDAKRLALLDAKRLALEKAGTYVEGITEVKNFNLTKEEIRAYTAGIVEVVEQATRDTMEGATHIVRVDVRVKIDTDIVATQIDSLRKNEAAKGEILRLRAETERLYRELADFKVKEASSPAGTSHEALQHRGQVINKAEANALLSRAWGILTNVYIPRTEESQRQARLFVEKAIAIDPESSDAHYALGYILSYQHKDLIGAQQEFQEALRLDRNNTKVHSELGALFMHLGDFVKAAKEYEEALRLWRGEKIIFGIDFTDSIRMNLAEAYERLGKQAQQQGDFEAAVSYFRKAIQLVPGGFGGHLLLGDVLLENGKLDAAIEEYRTAVRLHPDFAGTHFSLAEALKAKGDLADAIVEYQISVRLDPEFGGGPAQNQYGIALHESGRIEEAIPAFRTAVRLRPDEGNVHHNLGKALAKKGAFDDAIVEYRTALRLKPDSAMAHNDLGVTLRLTSDLEASMKEFRHAIDLKPDEPWYHYNLGYALFEIQDYKSAAAELREAIRLKLGDAKVHYYLANALEALGQKAEAIGEFREFLKLAQSRADNDPFIEKAKAAIAKAE